MEEARRLQAERYRIRAQQIRTTAGMMTHFESRVALLKLADSYDRLALLIEHDRTPVE